MKADGCLWLPHRRFSNSGASTSDQTETEDNQINEAKEAAYQVIIGVSGALSIISLLCLCLVVPSLYSYVDTMNTFSTQDFKYCEITTTDMETEIESMGALYAANMNRTKRASGQYAGYNPTLLHPNAPTFQECPACCTPGERGPTGDGGLPGMPGTPGPDAPGRPGTTPNASCIPERVFEPPPCLPCPQGPRGVPGFPGFQGDVGMSGQPGVPGLDGQPGIIGENGPDGLPGVPGLQGPKGDKGVTPEAHVIPGPPGLSGEPGAFGPPGLAGMPGEDGFPGPQGEKGMPGPSGINGPIGAPGRPGPAGENGPSGTPGTCVCQDTEVVMSDERGKLPAPAPAPAEKQVETAPATDYNNEKPASTGYYQRKRL